MYATFEVPWDGFQYTPTDEDLIWLATALQGEAGKTSSEEEYARVAWTWLNRFMLKSNRPWPSLQNLIQNHSQPVNPRWRRDGQFCKPGGKYHGKTNCTEGRLARRDKYANIINNYDLGGLAPRVVDIAEKFLQGYVQEPSTVDGYPSVDFATNNVARNHGTQYDPQGEWFLTTKEIKGSPVDGSFIDDHVVVVATSDGSAPMTDPAHDDALGGFSNDNLGAIVIGGIVVGVLYIANKIWGPGKGPGRG